jgi:hypothetical protein
MGLGFITQVSNSEPYAHVKNTVKKHYCYKDT